MLFTISGVKERMETISAGDQFEHKSVGRVEVQKVFINGSSVQIAEDGTIANPTSFVNEGEPYVRMYCYVSGMPGEERLSEFRENVEPYGES